MIRTLIARLLLATAAAVVALGGPAHAADAAAAATPIPLEAFARLPMVEGVTLAPGGQRFAVLLNQGADTWLAVRELEGGGPLKALLKSDNKQFRFAWARWVNDERLLVSVRYPGRRGWIESTETRLFSIRRDGTGMVNLVRTPSFDRLAHVAQYQDGVIDWLPDDGQHVLLQLVEDHAIEPTVFRVNVETGRRSAVHAARGGVRQWITDATHRVRVGIKRHDARVDILVSDRDGTRWRTAWTFDVLDRTAVWPLGFGADPDKLIVTAEHDGRRALFEVNLTDDALTRQLLLSHPRFDLRGELMTAPKTGQAIGVRIDVLGDAAAGFWDADTKRLLQAIDQALPQRRNQLLQFSADGARYLLKSAGNGQPAQYFVGTRATGNLALLAETYPELGDRTLARRTLLTIPTRDGELLPVALMLPPGARQLQSLPAVILPQGGLPRGDTIDFNPLAHFLADRGYAVLQLASRGSTGVVQNDLGLQRVGPEMQNDLADAAQWLTQPGRVDATRVCIVASGFGAHAALMSGATAPGLYRCIVSFAGITDLLELGAQYRNYLHGQAMFERLVGSTWDDSDRLKANSPRRLAEQFKAPVLLVHGTADRSVPVEYSELMASALKRAGKPHRLVTLEEGDHDLGHQGHRTQFFRELEAFLAEHLKGQAPAPAPAAKAP
ncbi:S9 family peptidase [Aquabacterium humicola]|uniref:S9 family peptidase n=1 Tax=Aquabacterium humicola TaxID=3237377 RepID=UPI002542A16D|nr:prolyl oligopeptidase family serine peptidase [Rubrivivax pictus]